MAVYSFRIGPYARDIYLYGKQRFTTRDGFSGIPEEYNEPVKEYASKNFTLFETERAQAQTWITQYEYEESIAYRTPDSPLDDI
ncbi:hypothetical protein [Bacillus sp. B-jedd]|uniref:hypothetical protein n=1 Tax=Bacillus sp. B-jedd TaxID=1476857 RepID=UPI0006626966|nr:hypothetical protein [Bacillus sp. B-jedd]